MQIPNFLKQDGDALLFNKDDETFVFYVPQEYFDSVTKNSAIAEWVGEYVSMLGCCNWTIIDKNGKPGPIKLFNFPTMFLCKPSGVEKVKNFKLDKNVKEADYTLLKFQKGDEIIHQINVPMSVENVEMFYKLLVMTAKLPIGISYDDIWKVMLENGDLNGFSYGINIQLINLLIATLCRNPNDLSEPYRYSDMKDPFDYKLLSIKMIPKYISPYAAITSEGFDQSIAAAILMKDKSDKDIPDNPIEKILTM